MSPQLEWDQNMVKYAACMLENCGVIAVATDTVYGLICASDSASAVKKLYEIKNREESKPLILLTKDLEQAQIYGVFDKHISEVAKKFWPGALTIIAETKLANIFNNPNIGIRVANNNFINQFISFIGKPVFATSVNISSEPSAIFRKDIDPSIESRIDGVFDFSNVTPSGTNSTIISYISQRLELIREGQITFQEINENYLNIKNSLR